MVALTAMLVLAAFFTQTSNTIPKTAYLKLIDVWYLVLICQVFAIIVSLVYVENLRLRYKFNTVEISILRPFESKNLHFHKANRFCKVFFPVITAAILITFLIAGTVP
ncbi:hypothetical protein E2C01_075463 [Portunus trituberculatus]|uniref:Neurotransmitter-gated ion-channel transmembrane domain-containing protein n=1 Tax=Portunus trituberculatus TaxID=210409 RepID=A0A5B7IG79_PORTR|nr:hypothetical protein [Portunus trituberculatus]